VKREKCFISAARCQPIKHIEGNNRKPLLCTIQHPSMSQAMLLLAAVLRVCRSESSEMTVNATRA
jgi:hypothetical protein